MKTSGNSKKELKSAAHLKCDFKTSKNSNTEEEAPVKVEAPKQLTGEDFPTLNIQPAPEPKVVEEPKKKKAVNPWAQGFRTQLDIRNFPALASNSNKSDQIASAWKTKRS